MNLKQNLKNTNEIVSIDHHTQQEMKQTMERIEKQMSVTNQNVLKLLMLQMNSKKLDLSDIFPLKNKTAMRDFMDKDHPDYHYRKQEFCNLLLLTVSNNIKKFSEALMDTFFDREFTALFKWPTPG